MSFLLFYVTYPDQASALLAGQQLVEQRLAACFNVFPIQSGYWWQGQLQKEGEWVCVLKTPLALEGALEAALLGTHPYETPCLLRWEVRANQAYTDWIIASTKIF
jgi:periplasmic divalent cation tolerance protein